MSPVPVHMSFAIPDGKDVGVFMHMKEQLDLVPAGAPKRIFNRDISRGSIKSNATPVNKGIVKAHIPVVFRFDRYLFRGFVEP